MLLVGNQAQAVKKTPAASKVKKKHSKHGCSHRMAAPTAMAAPRSKVQGTAMSAPTAAKEGTAAKDGTASTEGTASGVATGASSAMAPTHYEYRQCGCYRLIDS